MTTLTVQAKDKKHLSKIKLALKAVDAEFSQNLTLKKWEKDILEERLNGIIEGNFETQEQAHKIFDKCFK